MTRIAGDRRDRLRAMLADLKMPGALEAVDGILAEGRQRRSGPPQRRSKSCLGRRSCCATNRRLETAMRSSRLPAVKDPGAVRLRLSAEHQTRADR